MDRLLLVLGAIILVVLLAWYAFLFAIAVLAIKITWDPTVGFVVSGGIPSFGVTALLLLTGWGIHAHRTRPPLLFVTFVILALIGWATGVAASIWVITAIRSGNFLAITAATSVSSISSAAHVTALFPLLLLALPQQSLRPNHQPATIPPSGLSS